jgi:peptidase S41-like protein
LRALVACAAGLLPAPNAAVAQANLSFERAAEDGALPEAWSRLGPATPDDGARARLDSSIAAHGTRSLQVVQSAADALTRIGQPLAVAALLPRGPDGRALASRLRVRAAVRAAGATQRPGIWLRIAGGQGTLYLDSRGRGSDSPAAEPVGAAAPAADWAREQVELPLPADADEVRFGAVARGAGSAWFDDFSVEVIAADRLPPASASAQSYLDAALAILEESSINRARIDWRALRAATAEYARGASTAADAHLALRYAIYALGDRHSYLQTPETAAQLRLAPVSNARTGRGPIEPRAELVDGRLGYVAVPSVAGGSPQSQVQFATRVQQLIKELDSPGTCGWILDLRRNTGGNLWPMLAGVGPLLGDGEAAASVYPDGRRVPVWYRDGQAGFGEYTQLRVFEPYRLAAAAPVAILIGPATASSAEILTVAFRGRPGAASFGAATSGLSAGNKTFTLRDGAALILTVAATSDRAGRTYLGPIDPDHAVAPASEQADVTRAAAAVWLASSRSCGAHAADAAAAVNRGTSGTIE